MISSLFIMVVVLLAAAPSHLGLLVRTLGQGGDPARRILAWIVGPLGSAVCLTLVVAAGVAATLVPLRLGLHAFRRLEP